MLGCRLDTIPIAPAVEAFDAMLAPTFGNHGPDLTEENLQSRIRGVTLMGLSNKFGHMLLTTGNKSEMSVGYATIYGDLAGGYSVLKDRKSVVAGRSVSVRVDLGGRRFIKKKRQSTELHLRQ